MNAFEQFQVPLDGISLHIHPRGIDRTYCRFCSVHGSPASVWEFYKLIPRLTDPSRFGGDPASGR